MYGLHFLHLIFALMTASTAGQSCAATAVLDLKYVCAVDSDSVPTNTCESAGVPREKDCMPTVGMDVTLICSNDATGVLYAKGMPLGTNVTTYQQATTAVSGLYECRGSAGNASRFVSVQTQPVIGVASSCMTPECCSPLSSVSLPVSFNLFCANCTVSLAVSWTNHLPIDLDLVLKRNGTTYTISRGSSTKTPYAVYPVFPPPLTALITASARDVLTSSSVALCFSTTFAPAVQFSAYLYAPTQPVMKGDYAVTSCQYSRSGAPYSIFSSFVVLNFTMASGISYTATCGPFLTNMVCIIANFSSVAMVSIRNTPQGNSIIGLTVNLTNISDVYNGMTVSCSLIYEDSVQWTNVSRLYVTGPSPQTSPTATPAASSWCQTLCKGLLTGLLAPTILIAVTILIVLTIRKLTRQPAGRNAGSECPPLPTSMAGNSRYAHSMVYYRSHSQPDLGRSNNRQPKRVRIYVSYSDDKLDWVRNTLEPILHRMIHAEVVLRENAMVVGQPVSEERLRLILEADKVLVVCSPQYEASPWCRYELLQSVNRDPSLTEGRVVPILCDGCSTVPAVIGGVVSLKDCDLQFESKLQESVLRTK